MLTILLFLDKSNNFTFIYKYIWKPWDEVQAYIEYFRELYYFTTSIFSKKDANIKNDID